MSWPEAKAIAEKIYRELRAEHDAGFVRMVIRALIRLLDGDEKSGDRSSHLPHPSP